MASKNNYSSYAGKSMPMDEKFPEFAMIGVYDKKKAGLKFVRITSKQFEGKYTVILFMDNKASDLEVKEWISFSDKINDFKNLNVGLFGVCTDSHVAVRSFMSEHHLQNIKFPIISDRDGDFSRSFGVLKVSKNDKGAMSFDAARALVIMNDKMEMIYLTLKNENTASNPDEILDVLKKLMGADSDFGSIYHTPNGSIQLSDDKDPKNLK